MNISQNLSLGDISTEISLATVYASKWRCGGDGGDFTILGTDVKVIPTAAQARATF